MRRSDLIKLIKEELGAIISEQSTPSKEHILAACAIFANKYVKGKEQQQLPRTIMMNTSMQEGDRYTPSGKSTKPKKLKVSKDGSVVYRKSKIGHLASPDAKTTKSQILTKKNAMNRMIDAVGSLLLYGKGNSNRYDKENQYVKKILEMASRLSQAQPGQYDLKKWTSIAQQTEVAGDSIIESNFLSRRESESTTNIAKDGSTHHESYQGAEVEDFLLSTTVEYLTGPLSTKTPGDFSGLKGQASKQHLMLE